MSRAMPLGEALALAEEWEGDPHSDLTQRACAALLRHRAEQCAADVGRLADAVIAEADMAARPGQHGRLLQIAEQIRLLGISPDA